MGRSLTLYWRRTIPEADMLFSLTGLGGVIHDYDQLDVGVSRGPSRVWLYNVRGALAGRFETPSEKARARLVGAPQVGISINLSSDPGSSQLALDVTRQLLDRWPGVAECALYTALGLHDAEHRLSAVLGPAACFPVAVDSSIILMEALAACGGLSIGPSDPEMMASLTAELQAVDKRGWHSVFDAARDEIVGVVPVGQNHASLVRSPAAPWLASTAPADRRVIEAAVSLLGAQPSRVLRLILGESEDDGEAERQVLALLRAISRNQPAVMVGLFSLVLDHDDIARMVASGDAELQ